MEKKESFVFYRSFYEALVGLDDKVKLEIFNSICELALNNKEIETTGIATNIFTLIKPQINANNERYENGKKGAKFGKLGGRPKREKNPSGVFDENPKETPNVNVNENDNVNVNVCVSDNTQQNTHTLDQIFSFAKENFEKYNQNDLKKSCEKYFEYYEEKNWEGVKNWKSKLKLWINDDIENGKIKEARQKRYL